MSYNVLAYNWSLVFYVFFVSCPVCNWAIFASLSLFIDFLIQLGDKLTWGHFVTLTALTCDCYLFFTRFRFFHFWLQCFSHKNPYNRFLSKLVATGYVFSLFLCVFGRDVFLPLRPYNRFFTNCFCRRWCFARIPFVVKFDIVFFLLIL